MVKEVQKKKRKKKDKKEPGARDVSASRAPALALFLQVWPSKKKL
jgi:hypothetical protein